MKILTHNLLQCNVAPKHCKGSKYPLVIEAAVDSSASEQTTSWTHTKAEYAPEFLERLLPKINWPAIRHATEAIRAFDPCITCPETPPYYKNVAEEAMEIEDQHTGPSVVPWW